MTKRKLQFNNILSRLLFFNIILILLATILPQIALYQYYSSQYRKKLEETNYNNIKQVRDFVDENVFERLVKIPVTYFSETSSENILMEPINHNIRNKSYELLQISQKLSEIQASHPFVSNIDLYYPYNQLLFQGAHVFFLEDYDHGFKNPVLKEIMMSEEPVVWAGLEDEEAACVYVRSIPYFSTPYSNKAMLAIEVDEEALISAVEKTRISNQGFFGIVTNGGELILDIRQDQFQLYLAEESLDKISTISKDGFFKSRINYTDYIISYAVSDYNEWKYISILQVEDVFSGLFDLRIWLAILCGIFSGLNVVFAILLTKKAHRPMEYIVNNISNYVGENQSPKTEKNQYKLMENTFHTLAFQVKDLNDHLSANQPIIYHNMIMRILKSKDQGLYRDSEMIEFKKELFICFVVIIYHPREMVIHNRMLVNYRMNDLLNSNKTWYDVYSITDENDLLYGIINFDDKSSLQKVVDDMFGHLETSISTSFNLCLGAVTDDEAKISDSYREACEMKKYSFFYEERQKLYYDDLKLPKLSAAGKSEKLLEKVRAEIRSNDWNQLNKTIDSIIELVSKDIYTADYRMNTLADFVSVVRKSVIVDGYDAAGLFGGDIREQLKDIGSIREFREWLDGIIQILIRAASSKKETPTEDLKAKIEEYVKEHIFHDLTLSKMSDDLGISSSYLSRIFKNIMGVNCSEYLIKVKLDKAQELLAETDDTVKEISEKLGYSSTAHFIRIFKENFGCTPKQSRKKEF